MTLIEPASIIDSACFSFLPLATGIVFNIVWLVVFILLSTVGIGMTYWINFDAETHKQNRTLWVLVMGASLMATVGLLIGTGQNGLVLYLIAQVAPFGIFFGYVHNRDSKLPEQQRLLNPENIGTAFRNALLRIGIRVKTKPEFSTSGIAVEGLVLMNENRLPLETAHKTAGIRGELLARTQQILLDLCSARAEMASVELRGDQVVLTTIRSRKQSELVRFPAQDGLRVGQYLSALLGNGQILPLEGTGSFLIKTLQDPEPIRIKGKQRTMGPHAFRLDLVLELPPAPQLKLGDLGFLPKVKDLITKLTAAKKGLILVTAPPHHGSTATYYALVNSVDGLLRDIISYEAEITSPIDHSRQEPIGDLDTAGIAAKLKESAITGCDVAGFKNVHDLPNANRRKMVPLLLGQAQKSLVIARIQARKADEAITQLIAWGADPQQLSETLLAVINQRLMGRLCDLCKQPLRPDPKVLAQVGLAKDGSVKFYRNTGCPGCLMSGYSGLTALFEVFINGTATKPVIASGGNSTQLRNAARQGGSLLFADSSILKAAGGTASPADISNVLGK